MSINGDFADSEYGDDFIEQESFSDTTSEKYDAKADKRAHHNALERKRRDHIKDSFSSLKNAVPTFNGEKASRAQILKKAAEYINNMRQKNNDHQKDIDLLKKENKLLEEKIKALEGMKNGHGVSLTSNRIDANEKTNNFGNHSFGNLVELDSSMDAQINLSVDNSNQRSRRTIAVTTLSTSLNDKPSDTTSSPFQQQNKRRKA